MKIVIIGYSGAGKTTLANALAEALKCGVFHVDSAMYDGSEQRKAPAAMAIAEQRMSTLGNGGWIIDGYREQCVKEAWLEESDRMIFLNIGKWTCFWRIVKRYIRSFILWIRGCMLKILKSARQAAGQPPATDRISHIPMYLMPMNILRHLDYIIREEHSSKFEAYYMGIGGRYSEKFVVMRTQREINRFREVLLKEAGR